MITLDWFDYIYNAATGRLTDEFGIDPFPLEPAQSLIKWEDWMESNDIRGSIK